MSTKELLAEYAVLASQLEHINETLQEMNSVDMTQLLNTIRLIERKMGFAYTSFKSSVYSVISQSEDPDQGQDNSFLGDDQDRRQSQQGSFSQTPENRNQQQQQQRQQQQQQGGEGEGGGRGGHRGFQLEDGEEGVSFMDPPQRPEGNQTPNESNSQERTSLPNTSYENHMMRSSLFRNQRPRMSFSEFINMQQQQQQQQQRDYNQQQYQQPEQGQGSGRVDQPMFRQRLQQNRSENGPERSVFSQSRGVGHSWSRDHDTNRPRYF